jgi:anti-anti-sigma factor
MSIDQTFDGRELAGFPPPVVPRPAGRGRRPVLRVRSAGESTVADILDAETLFDVGEICCLSEQLHRLLDSGHSRLVLDFRGVHSMSSDVLGVLAALHRRAEASRCRLALAGLDPAFREMLGICRLDRLFEIDPDEAEKPAAAG